MRRPRSSVAAALAGSLAVLCATLGTGVLTVLSTAATGSAAVAAKAPKDYECGANPGKRQVVLLVHGFNSSPDAAWSEDARKYLASNKARTCIAAFDYAARSTDWVTSSFIGPRLAEQIQELSERSRSQGGPGKIVIVAHSMGGLAVRCAVADSCSRHHAVASDISALVTFGTPNLGTGLKGSGRSLLSDVLGPSSSAACQTLVALGELPDGSCMIFQAFGTSDAARAFTPESAELKALPPLTETSSFPVTAVAGQVLVTTTYWGLPITLGDAGDLVVNEDSALAEARTTGGIGGPVTISCGKVHLGIRGTSERKCWHSDMTNNQQFLTVALHTITKVQQATAAQRHVTVAEDGAFVTPSGNIVCLMSHNTLDTGALAHEARCDITEWEYETPPRPEFCPTDWGHAFQVLADDSEGVVMCAGDTIARTALVGGSGVEGATAWFQRGVDKVVRSGGEEFAALNYGSSMREGDNVCAVETDGVTCTNTRTGHGFFVSRGAYRVF